MLKLIDTSQESMSSSLQGLKGTDVQSDSSSELESPMSMSSKSSFNCSPKDDLSKKKQKDLRKKLLQDLMSAEVTRKEEELLKKHNIKLMNLNSPKHNLSEGRFQHEAYPVHTTCGSTPVMLLILIICLALGSFVVTWLFTDLLGPLQRRILVGDYDSLDAANEPYRLPWIPENEEIGSSYKYKGVIDVIPKITSDNIRSQDDPMSTVHDKGYKYQGVRDAVTKITSDNIRSQDDPMSTSHDIGYKYQGVRDVMTKITYDNIRSQDDPTSTVHDKGEKEPSVDDFHNFEEADFGVLKPSVDFNDLHRLEETNNNLETMLNDGGYNDEYQLAIEEGIENESNVMSESSDSDDLDDGIESEKEVGIEHLKPTVLKLLYYNVLKSHKKGDISMQNYTNMYRYLNSFLTTFGSFAATQSKMLNDRIHTLENFKEHNINYTFATTMFKYEIESGLIDDPFPISGSMIFTCLHRHLQYLQEALENIIKLRPKGSLSVAFKAAYDDILADYHHWFVEKFYLLGLSTLPTKEDALHRLNERFVEVSSMSQLAHGLKLVTGVLKELTQVTEVLLNKYNVTQMIPAQVIT
ncbi:unnamed protein product [Meganyctiphanes norvegica]|uniref:Glycolipid transfer protein domain-containing protein n=1 Tax=Meganyctiphanes norvegica TaxID=48144 RepID=A0AAV2PTP4_MEGNR